MSLPFDVLLHRVLPGPDGVTNMFTGILDQGDYNTFWSAMSNREHATRYMVALLESINNFRVSFSFNFGHNDAIYIRGA